MDAHAVVVPAVSARSEGRADAGRPWVMPLAVAMVAAVVSYLRIPARGHGTLYAEDGRVFIGDWLHGPAWRIPFRPYMGYQHLLPRITSGLVTWLLPIRWWAAAMTLAACALVGAGAALVYVFSKHVVAAPAARLGLAAVMVLSPLAGLEAVGNMANLHWYLLYLMPWVLLAGPGSTRAAMLIGGLALVVTLTEPQCVLFAPLAVFVGWRRPRSRLIVAGWALGLVGQIVTYLIAPRPRRAGFPSLSSAVKGYIANASLSDGSADHRDVGRFLHAAGWWAAGASLLVFLAFAAYACWRGSTTVRITVLSVLSVSAASWFGSFYENNSRLYNYDAIPRDQLIHAPLVRWGTAAAMLLAAVIPLAAGVLTNRRPPLWPVGAVVTALMAVVMCLSLTSPDNPRGGQRWGTAVKDAKATCRTTGQKNIEVPTTPRRWTVTVPCSDLR